MTEVVRYIPNYPIRHSPPPVFLPNLKVEYPIRRLPSPSKEDPMFTFITKGLEWASKNPEKVVAFGVGLVTMGIFLELVRPK